MCVRSLATSELIRWLTPTARGPRGPLTGPPQTAPDMLRARPGADDSRPSAAPLWMLRQIREYAFRASADGLAYQAMITGLDAFRAALAQASLPQTYPTPNR